MLAMIISLTACVVVLARPAKGQSWTLVPAAGM
jgi:hypothetical protein